jgi:hypothetical protein
VILVTPFDSLLNVARAHYPIFPVGLLLKHRFDSAALAPGISTPALFLTASHDQVVPVRFANNLHRRGAGRPPPLPWTAPTTTPLKPLRLLGSCQCIPLILLITDPPAHIDGAQTDKREFTGAMEKKTVLLLGATGLVGGHILTRLLNNDTAVVWLR